MIDAYGTTEIGGGKEVNQDAYAQFVPTKGTPGERLGSLFVVADGISSLARGDIASQTATRALLERYYDSALGASPPEERLKNALEYASATIREGAIESGLARMGTTIAGVVLLGRRALAFNVGDSRVYRVRGTTIAELSRDQVVPPSPESSTNLPLVMYLGQRMPIVPHMQEAEAAPGDVFVLCTDGLWKEIDTALIGPTVQGRSAEQSTRALVRAAYTRRNAPDNVTVAVVRVPGAAGGRRLLGLVALLLLVLAGVVGLVVAAIRATTPEGAPPAGTVTAVIAAGDSMALVPAQDATATRVPATGTTVAVQPTAVPTDGPTATPSLTVMPTATLPPVVVASATPGATALARQQQTLAAQRTLEGQRASVDVTLTAQAAARQATGDAAAAGTAQAAAVEQARATVFGGQTATAVVFEVTRVARATQAAAEASASAEAFVDQQEERGTRAASLAISTLAPTRTPTATPPGFTPSATATSLPSVTATPTVTITATPTTASVVGSRPLLGSTLTPTPQGTLPATIRATATPTLTTLPSATVTLVARVPGGQPTTRPLVAVTPTVAPTLGPSARAQQQAIAGFVPRTPYHSVFLGTVVGHARPFLEDNPASTWLLPPVTSAMLADVLPAPLPVRASIGARAATLRARNTARSDVVRVLQPGTPIEVLGVAAGQPSVWYLVRVDRFQGWVAPELVVFAGDASRLPIVPVR